MTEQCDREWTGNDCRCPVCDERKVDAAEFAHGVLEGR